jgi:nucleosome binding factor SPN SPT16 subunit
VLLLTNDGQCVILAAKKKCDFLEPAVGKAPKDGSITSLKLLVRLKSDDNTENLEELLKIAKGGLAAGGSNGGNVKIGVIQKEFQSSDGANKEGSIISGWEKKLIDNSSNTEIVDVAGGISIVMAVKDKEELDLLKKSSVLSNKVLKHGFVPRIEDVIDNSSKVTHEKLASEIEEILGDPSKIKLNVPKEAVDSCYFPIIQSGGNYDFKVSAQSNDDIVKFDIITVSLGARYQMYCSNVVRTFLVDAPKPVIKNYDTLLGMHEACLKAMVPGNPLKYVYATAVKYLTDDGKESLISALPKTLGFGVGIDFRDNHLLLNKKNTLVFRPGMVFSLAVSFAGLKLPESAKSSLDSKSAVSSNVLVCFLVYLFLTPNFTQIKDLSEYGLMLADTVAITDKGADVMTKFGKAVTDISYSINEDDDEDDEEESDDDDDRKLAKKIAREEEDNPSGGRRSGRLAANASSTEVSEGVVERERKQIELMARRNEERLRELARGSKRKGGDSKSRKAEELETYKDTNSLPDNVLPNQVKVDMANQCVILPICGNPVPFHISTIKNVVLPDPDSASYLRINFYTAGMAVGKDCPENTAKLVLKYAPYATFIREMTFRSLDSHSLTTVRLSEFNCYALFIHCAYRNVLIGISTNLRVEEACKNEGGARSRRGKPCKTRRISPHQKRASSTSCRPYDASRFCWSQNARKSGGTF